MCRADRAGIGLTMAAERIPAFSTAHTEGVMAVGEEGRVGGLEVRTMATEADWSRLAREHGRSSTPQPFGAVLAHARRARCRTVVVESDYHDPDYTAEYTLFYSTTFRVYPNCCQRLHFFAASFTDVAALSGSEEIAASYLGHTTVRPTDCGRVSATLLTPVVEAPDRDYHLCIRQTEVQLAGRSFSCRGSHFIQQDLMVTRCAHAATWMAIKFMSEEYGLPPRTTVDIAKETATLALMGRALPSEGLAPLQWVHGLGQLGYDPLLYMKSGMPPGLPWDPVGIAYKYVESRIPVILIMPQHAVTVVGHTFSTTHARKEARYFRPPKGEAVFTYSPSDRWVDGLIVHDDSLGPYRLLPASSQARDRFLSTSWRDCIAPAGGIYTTADDILGVIVPLPKSLYFRATTVETAVTTLLANAYRLTSSVLRDVVPEAGTFNRAMEHGDLVLRAYVMRSEAYKQALREAPPEDAMNETVGWLYLNMEMPEYIWIVEITERSLLCREKEHERRILGEVLLDGTSSQWAFPFLSVHLPGAVMRFFNGRTRLPLQEWRLVKIADDRPYRHLSRRP